MVESIDNDVDVVRCDAFDGFDERDLVDVAAHDQSGQSRKNFEVASQGRSQDRLQELDPLDRLLAEVDDVTDRLTRLVADVKSFRCLQRKQKTFHS